MKTLLLEPAISECNIQNLNWSNSYTVPSALLGCNPVFGSLIFMMLGHPSIHLAPPPRGQWAAAWQKRNVPWKDSSSTAPRRRLWMWPYLRNVAKEYTYIFLDRMSLIGSIVTKAKCALERFFIYWPAPPFMNVAIPQNCSENLTSDLKVRLKSTPLHYIAHWLAYVLTRPL